MSDSIYKSLLLTDETRHSRLAFALPWGRGVTMEVYTAVGDAFKNDMDGWKEIKRDDYDQQPDQ